MKILLISPSSDEFANHSKGKKTICTALPLLAAYTPSEHELIISDQNYGDNVYMDGVDLVGISAMTPQAHAAYKISDYYKQRGVKVVMGGIHASMLPTEALQHADSICIGEGDAVWKDIINDAETNKLKTIYKSEELFDMSRIPHLRNDLVKRKRTTFSHSIIQATRGCPYSCEFCITSKLFGNKYRSRPVENVIDEIKRGNSSLTVFIDDNIFGNLEYSEKLFKAMIPLKTRWAGQASLNMATKDPALLRLAKQSGCVGLFVGIESINNLAEGNRGIANKLGSDNLSDVSKKIKTLLSNRIIVQTSIIFGLDNDDLHTFRKTVDFLKVNDVSFSSFCILTPYPGTKIHERFKKEGRLLHEDWSQYNNQHVTFHPTNMTPQQLEDGSDWAGNELHTMGSIIKRFKSNIGMPVFYWGMNLYTRASNHRNHGPGHVIKRVI